MPIVIGLCGSEGSGKTSIARMLALRQDFYVESFATPLKAMLEACGVPSKYIYGSQEDKEAPLDILGGRSVRYALRTLGTEWGRELMSPNLWVHNWKIRAYQWPRVVADDVRFPNEVEAIHELGGIVLRVTGRGVEAGTHASDRASCLSVDGEVMNTGSLEETYRHIVDTWLNVE